MIEGSFDWRSFLKNPNFLAAPVSCFNHVALSRCWDSITAGILVEVKSPDCTTCCTNTPCCYWIAAVINVSGYLGLLRYEGFDNDSSQDLWVNLCTEPHIHPIGWCAENGMPLVPPKCIEEKHTDWKEYLVRRISRVRTIPPDFASKLEGHKHNVIKKGMMLEVVDKNLISAVRLATVSSVLGGRLHVKYEDCEVEDAGFWCHERSPLIHPIGWAQVVGHSLKGNAEYARQSLLKTLYRTYEPVDATWDMFVPVPNPVKNFKFQPEMKLEAIDPLNLSTICVATVTEVLRNNYLMIGIDGMTDADGSDCFCYHASSPCIFPPGFCESNGLDLTPPRGYKGEFKWPDYFKKTKSKPAPSILFHRHKVHEVAAQVLSLPMVQNDEAMGEFHAEKKKTAVPTEHGESSATSKKFRREVPNHGFLEGSFLEAVDLMEPRLICVATVVKVVGRLLRVHFEGWEAVYDQWCDCESPDLFPVGWCESVGYRLEPPREEGSTDIKKNIKVPATKTRRRRRRLTFTQKKRHSEDFEAVTIKTEPIDIPSS